ncbi:MAG: hypothetical protein M3O20_06665 [Acidobacteriota bacterium]|nr:hypothetical protein [Acidobacteriota bacterium]
MSLDTLPSVSVHPTDDLLEEYSFGRVLEPELERIEEHLLDCTFCQDRLLAVDEYTALMKAGIAALEREGEATQAAPHFAIPGALAVCAAALLLALVGISLGWRLQPSAKVASASVMTVRLTALRGGDGEGMARARFGHPLDLTVDRTDLPAAAAYRLEIVNASGQRLWSRVAQVDPQSLSARLTERLAPGVYWVRLYSDGRLRREFGLRVE